MSFFISQELVSSLEISFLIWGLSFEHLLSCYTLFVVIISKFLVFSCTVKDSNYKFFKRNGSLWIQRKKEVEELKLCLEAKKSLERKKKSLIFRTKINSLWTLSQKKKKERKLRFCLEAKKSQ